MKQLTTATYLEKAVATICLHHRGGIARAIPLVGGRVQDVLQREDQGQDQALCTQGQHNGLLALFLEDSQVRTMKMPRGTLTAVKPAAHLNMW